VDVHQQAVELDLDLEAVMGLILRAAKIHEKDALFSFLTSDLASVLHHEAMLCGSGTSDPDGSYTRNLLHHNYPLEYLKAIATTEGRVDSPLMQRWRATLEPIVFQSGRDDAHYPVEWVHAFKKNGLRNTVGHAVLDARNKFGSYFIFSNIRGEVGPREILILKLITPHLHFALMRVLSQVPEARCVTGSVQEPLTNTQMQILHWMNQGKTNWEIAQILSMSGNNVKYNIEKIFSKLEVKNRAQAVSKAMLLGLLNA
jgi:transcriptional regulator EpsA